MSDCQKCTELEYKLRRTVELWVEAVRNKRAHEAVALGTGARVQELEAALREARDMLRRLRGLHDAPVVELFDLTIAKANRALDGEGGGT